MPAGQHGTHRGPTETSSQPLSRVTPSDQPAQAKHSGAGQSQSSEQNIRTCGLLLVDGASGLSAVRDVLGHRRAGGAGGEADLHTPVHRLDAGNGRRTRRGALGQNGDRKSEGEHGPEGQPATVCEAWKGVRT